MAEPVKRAAVAATPQTQWYQFLDRFTSIDEILRQHTDLLRIISEKEVVIQSAPETPITVDDKLNALIDLLTKIAQLLGPTTKLLTDHKRLTTSADRILDQAQATRSLIVKSASTNTGTIYIGAKGVSSGNGLSLSAGQAEAIDHDNSKENLYAFSTVSGDVLEMMLIW